MMIGVGGKPSLLVFRGKDVEGGFVIRVVNGGWDGVFVYTSSETVGYITMGKTIRLQAKFTFFARTKNAFVAIIRTCSTTTKTRHMSDRNQSHSRRAGMMTLHFNERTR